MKFPLFIFILLSFSSFALTKRISNRMGGVNGGGADFAHVDESAWFLKGHKPSVDICIHKSHEFGVSDFEIELTLRKVYQKWEEYIQSHNIYSTNYDFDPLLMMFENNINVSFSPKCKNTDIDMFFGIRNEEIDKIISKFNDPLGFSHKRVNFAKEGWSNGIIWIGESRYWKDIVNLEGILTHEIGHTLGISHIDKTIMTKDILFHLGNDYYREQIQKIDWERKLFNCTLCENSNGGMWLAGSNHEKLAMEKIFGIEVQAGDKITTGFKTNLVQKKDLKSNDYTLKGDLILNYNGVVFKFPFSSSISNVTFQYEADNVFFRQREIKENDGEDSWSSFGEGERFLDIGHVLIQANIFGKMKMFIIENDMFSNTFFPPYGEEIVENRLWMNNAIESIFMIENGIKYNFFSKVVQYDF